MTTPPERRWAVVHYRHADPRIPTVLATFWTRRGATNARRHLTTGPQRRDYRITPMDRASYRDRAATITGQLHHGPLSVTGLALRTAMSTATISDTLLRMARDRRVVHQYNGDDRPTRGVWRALTALERASGARLDGWHTNR